LYLSLKKKADNTNLYTGNCANFSGNWNNGDNAGTFQLNVNNTASNSNSNLGTQQMFNSVSGPRSRKGARPLIYKATVALPLGKIQKSQICISTPAKGGKFG